MHTGFELKLLGHSSTLQNTWFLSSYQGKHSQLDRGCTYCLIPTSMHYSKLSLLDNQNICSNSNLSLYLCSCSHSDSPMYNLVNLHYHI